MHDPKNREEGHAPAPPEAALSHLLEEHRKEELEHELNHRGLLHDLHSPDHDRRHDLPLLPGFKSTSDPHPLKHDIA